MATFYLMNFGCRASQADGAALKKQLLEAGLEESACVEQSEIAVLNTCTVTAVADAEVRQVVRRVHRSNPACRIVVTGCYAQRAPVEVAALPGVAWVVGNSHKHALAEFLRDEGRTRDDASGSTVVGTTKALVRVGEISEEFHFSPVFPDERTRPTLKVQDGCNARCSFCIIPAVRGPGRSLAPEKAVEEIRLLGEAGFKEIVLSGINLGSYGKDLGRPITFLSLLERILAETSMPRLRISSIEPMDVSPELIRLVAGEPRLARHFHVPLQSGCDRILRLMNRRYWTSQYAERVLSIREQVPSSAVGADVMVGFPGETDADHEESARFIDSLPFTYLHVFPYSARPGTPAAGMVPAVSGRVARERSLEIRALAAKKARVFLAAQVGRSLSSLTLDATSEGARMALTTNYLKVALPSLVIPRNVLLDVRFHRVVDGVLHGYPESACGFESKQACSVTEEPPAAASATRTGLRLANLSE